MSGPVWRKHQGDTVSCSECLRQSSQAFAVGEVVDGEYHTNRYLCPDCYPEQIKLISKRR